MAREVRHRRDSQRPAFGLDVVEFQITRWAIIAARPTYGAWFRHRASEWIREQGTFDHPTGRATAA